MSDPESEPRSDRPAGARGDAPGRPRPPRSRPSRPRPHWSLRTLHLTYRGILLMVFAPLAFALIAGISLFNREVTAPSWVKDLVETRAAEVLEGGNLTFGSITVEVGSDLHPHVRLTNMVLTDAAGTVIARVPQVDGQISPRGLLFRRELLVQKIHLTGAQIALRRNADGTVAVAFDNAGTAVRQASSFVALLDQSDQVFERPALEALEEVSAEGLIVNFDDARAGRSWTVDGGRLALDLTHGQTRLSGDLALLSGRDFVTTMQLRYVSPRGSRSAQMRLTLADVDAADIATQSPALSWLAVLDARMSATLDASLDEAGNLGPLIARLDIGAGAVQPTPQARPIRFDEAKAELTFDPGPGLLGFDEVEVRSDWGGFSATGHAYLKDETGGSWPGALIGQFRFTDIAVSPAGFYAAPERFSDAAVDLRLRLDPFRLDVGQFMLSSPTETAVGRAEVAADEGGWSLSLDANVPRLDAARVVALWPLNFREGTRKWFDENMHAGELTNAAFSARVSPGVAPVLAATFDFSDAAVSFMKTMPPIEAATGTAGFLRDAFTLRIDQGHVAAPQGGLMDVTGSTFQITDTRYPDPPAIVDIAARGTITAALSLLDLPPFEVMQKANLPVTLADGRAQIAAHVTLPLMDHAPRERIRYAVAANLTDVRSSAIVPGKTVTGTGLSLSADDDHLRIVGPVQVGQVPMQVDWHRAQSPGTDGGSHLDATVEISQRFLDEFNIGLPRGSLSGQGEGTLSLDLPPGRPPQFTLSSRLVGVGLALPPLGWSKARGTPGRIEVAGVLGAAPRIDRLTLDAAGLTADGSVSVAPGGGLDRARFARVRLGGWFDAPVELRGRGLNKPAEVVVDGGSLDLRRASFGDAGGAGGPMSLKLDRLQITEGIALTAFQGQFSAAAGFSGQFTARVNDGPEVRGTVVPQNGRSAVRLLGDDAGAIIAAAGLLSNASGGSFDLSLLPSGTEGNYDGTLAVTDLRVKHAPALASLLDAVSVVGLLQQMDGQGLAFANVDADFRIDPDTITVARSSAVGAGLGISMDGVYTLATRNMDFQGVISPFYLINGIGSILTRRGEGLIGFNYTLKGSPDDPQVAVNPLSLLTPGMFRNIFRRPPPELSQ